MLALRIIDKVADIKDLGAIAKGVLANQRSIERLQNASLTLELKALPVNDRENAVYLTGAFLLIF